MRRKGFSLFFIALIFLLSVTGSQARDRKKVSALTHYIQAGLFEALNELERAVSEYKAALRADYTSPQIHLRLAVALFKQNQLSAAADELKQAIKYYEKETDPSVHASSLIEVHTLLALVYSLQGNLEEATAEYEMALRGALAVDPQNIQIHKGLARVYLQKNKLFEAEKIYRFILELAPDDSEAHFFLGSIYEQRGERDEAIEEFKAAVEFNPEHADALNSLGYLYAEEGIHLEDAEQLIKKALEFEPNNGAYIDSIGWVYFKQGRYEEAVFKLEQAVQFLPDALIYEHLGDAYLKQGNLIKARESWQKSLEINSARNPQIEGKIEQITNQID